MVIDGNWGTTIENKRYVLREGILTFCILNILPISWF